MKIQPSSLVKAGKVDEFKFGGMLALEVAKLYANHAKVVDFGTTITPVSLRGRVSPHQALGGLVVLMGFCLVVLGYVIGFTKVMVLFSLLGMLVMTSSPDWIEGIKQNKPMKLVLTQSAKNLGMRWKEMIRVSSGYNVSDKMALVSLVLVVMCAGKILITPTASSVRLSGDSPVMSAPKYDLEFIYKLGYDDGKSKNEFGASLPSDVMTGSAGMQSSRSLEDVPLDWNAYNPPLLKPKPKLGMGTLLSMFALFRFGKDLVTYPDGRLIRDPNLIIAKVKSLEPWRMGMLFMSLYRVVGTLMAFLW
jgi:hypothetical protein